MAPPLNLSVQLYSVRDALAEDFDGTLSRIASFGYTQVEPFGFSGFIPQLTESLPKYGLSAPTTHCGLVAAVDEQDNIFAAAKELGVSTVIDPYIDRARWQSEADIKQVAADLNAAAEKAASYGVTVGYHNHAFELESVIDGRHGLDILADNLDPGVVLEVDTYWAFTGGADVGALLGRLSERVVAIHVKDGDGTADVKAQVAVGQGTLAVWDFIAAAPDDVLAVVELDDCSGDIVQAVADSFTYLSKGQPDSGSSKGEPDSGSSEGEADSGSSEGEGDSQS